MAGSNKRLVYFERWMAPVGEEIVGAAPDIQLEQLGIDDDASSWAALEMAHGYQLLPSTETLQRFFPRRTLIERCPQLLCISASGAGYDMIDVNACTEAGVLVVNQSGANSESVAQHVLGMMLVLAKQVPQSDRAIRGSARNWTRTDYTGCELTGKTIGIIGLGNIGRRVAELCTISFGMRVLAYDPYITTADFKARQAEPVDWPTVFAEADFISVNCPLTEETRGMVDAAACAMIKPGAFFISTARGGIHDEVALAASLAEGRLAGAGLDVFEVEPPPADHPLLAFENVIVSPHIAGVTVECRYNVARAAAEQWLTIFAGLRPPRLVNPDAWDTYRVRFEQILGQPALGETG